MFPEYMQKWHLFYLCEAVSSPNSEQYLLFWQFFKIWYVLSKHLNFYMFSLEVLVNHGRQGQAA